MYPHANKYNCLLIFKVCHFYVYTEVHVNNANDPKTSQSKTNTHGWRCYATVTAKPACTCIYTVGPNSTAHGM